MRHILFLCLLLTFIMPFFLTACSSSEMALPSVSPKAPMVAKENEPTASPAIIPKFSPMPAISDTPKNDTCASTVPFLSGTPQATSLATDSTPVPTVLTVFPVLDDTLKSEKVELKATVQELKKCTAGEDYIENQVFASVVSEGTAIAVGTQYAMTLITYRSGIATYTTTKPVLYIIELAAADNELYPVYPCFIRKLMLSD